MNAIMTPEQAAKYLSLGKRTIYSALQSGQLPGRRIGRSWRISTRVLDAWLAGEEIMETFLLERLFREDIDSAREDHASGQGVSVDALIQS